MKSLIKNTNIQGRKTNHSARKTMVETLCRSNIPDSTVMQLSGHKSIQSLNHYKTPSLGQQQYLSHLLSGYALPRSTSHKSVLWEEMTKFRQGKKENTEGGLFSNGQFTNCTFNIQMAPSTSATSCAEKRAKRAKIVYTPATKNFKRTDNLNTPINSYYYVTHVC